VSILVAAHQAESYQVSTDLYAGPLDLLLELIERSELDVTKLALAQVTDQYLEYLHQIEHQNAAAVSAFLVIAARLIQIKSAALLPSPSITLSQSEEEDPGEALTRQLLLFKRFKELASYLNDRQENGLRTYLRLASPPKINRNIKPDLSDITLEDLILAARGIFLNPTFLTSFDQVINMPRITIREKIQAILDRLRPLRQTTFRSMFSPNTNRAEIVITFLALLELVKRYVVAAQQTTLFADIQIQPLKEINGHLSGIALDYDLDEDRLQ